MENWPKIKKNNSKNVFLMDFFVNPRPFHNSNMIKVYIVKWSQKWIFVDASDISGIPEYFLIALKTAIFKIFGNARNGISVNKNLFLRPLNNTYFFHITG